MAGIAGMEAPLESRYLVGSKVMDDILDNRDVYANSYASTSPDAEPAGG